VAEVLKILVAGGLATYLWRYLGALAVRQIDPENAVLLWVRAVATALIAALVVRFVYAPSGLLAETLPLSRAAALAAGVVVFVWAGRRLEVGVAAAAVAMIAMEYLLHS
jgi:branched-subunit amino acid transport protein